MMGSLTIHLKITRISEYQVCKLMSKGQVDFLKDNVIFHIVTKLFSA
jgi:hypothetical protein